MFDTKPIKQAFETFGKEVIQLGRSNLSRMDKNVSKDLYNSMNYKYEGYKNGFRFVIEMDEYGVFQDAGVKGAKSSAKAPKSEYKFKNKKPPKQPIQNWVSRRGFQFRKANGQFMSYSSTAWLIQRSIFETGIPTTNWFTRAFELKFKRLQPKIEDAMAVSVEKLLDFTIKENLK